MPHERWGGVDRAEETWNNHGTTTISTSSLGGILDACSTLRGWSVFQQIFAEHWEAFQHAHPRYQTPYYNGPAVQDARLWQPREDRGTWHTAVCTVVRGSMSWR